VADTDAGMRTFRVDRVTSVVDTGEPVVRPDNFDLHEAWTLITDRVDELRTPVRARALVIAELVGMCRMMLGNRVSIGPTRADGRVEVELRGHSVEALAGEIAGLGGAIEVIDPAEMRERLAQVGAELVETYR
jgi:predicted DNA-binding transcriptional regulator YafY